MFLYRSVKCLSPEERKEGDILRAECRRLKADLDYIAMMAEIPMEEEEENEKG